MRGLRTRAVHALPDGRATQSDDGGPGRNAIAMRWQLWVRFGRGAQLLR